MNYDVKNMTDLELISIHMKTNSPVIGAEIKRRQKKAQLDKFKLIKD